MLVLPKIMNYEVAAEAMSGLEAFYAPRAEVEKNNLPELTLEEINEGIRLARE